MDTPANAPSRERCNAYLAKANEHDKRAVWARRVGKPRKAEMHESNAAYWRAKANAALVA